MKYKAEHKGKQRFGNVLKPIVILVLSLALLLCVFLVLHNGKTVPAKESNKTLDDLKVSGMYRLDEITAYEFDGNGKGVMYTDVSSYAFEYKMEKNKLSIDFENEVATDKTYDFSIDGNVLILKSGEQTYRLVKETE